MIENAFKLIILSPAPNILSNNIKLKKNDEMTTSNNNFQARVQLQYFHRMPVEIITGDNIKSEPFQLPCDFINSVQQPVSAAKQAFLDMASAPLLNLDDLDESFNFNDSDPEILLSDSEDEEDEGLIAMGDRDELDAETAIDSDDMNNMSEEGMEEFDEQSDDSEPLTTNCSVHNSSFNNISFHSNTSPAHLIKPRRIFIDLPEVSRGTEQMTSNQ